MDGLLGQSDGLIRLAVFAAVFAVMAAIELLRPKRRLSVSKARRWLTNLGIAGVDTLVLRIMAALAVPIAAVAAAFFGRRVALVELAEAGPGGATVHTGTSGSSRRPLASRSSSATAVAAA